MEKTSFKILVADDDDIVRDVVATLLEREGYYVLTAHDGLAAIDRLRNEEIHLVLTDLMMPGADGLEVLKYAVRSNPDGAVVILTAYGTLDTTLTAIGEGAYDYLTKPFKAQEITIVAERAWQRARLIEENRELKKSLRETYCDLALLKEFSASANQELVACWVDRIARLRAGNVLSSREAEMLTKKLAQVSPEAQGAQDR